MLGITAFCGLELSVHARLSSYFKNYKLKTLIDSTKIYQIAFPMYVDTTMAGKASKIIVKEIIYYWTAYILLSDGNW